MKSWASYAALSAGAIAALAAVLGLTAFTSPDDRLASYRLVAEARGLSPADGGDRQKTPV